MCNQVAENMIMMNIDVATAAAPDILARQHIRDPMAFAFNLSRAEAGTSERYDPGTRPGGGEEYSK
ncbi:hypothetical protein MSAN_01906700 [Mycena sanguinolenta]|uniref:Uncharacterized protein n=1 Tax=Mycena sanguinolenta TaxID=230812 RepID=A0A8H6XP10_9AGAR|nr:hypothetical protein MSAN_01906700 [Mycena sanguinolenta]